MSVRANFDLERAELDTILASGAFAKSPNLARMLQYIVLKHLEGKEEVLKEYNIGVEALGRPAEFDPKEDSIVRVEAHRLREKLRRYYETEGADHAVCISLEVGHYLPRFQRRNELSRPAGNLTSPESVGEPRGGARSGEIPLPEIQGSASTADRASPRPASQELSHVHSGHWLGQNWKMLLTAAILVAATGVGAWIARRPTSKVGGATLLRPVAASAAATFEEGREVRILAGYSKKEYVDGMGRTWGPDRFYSGGGVLVEPQSFIARAADSRLFETAREGEFSYTIPLQPGTYEMRLYFVETTYGPATLRGGGEISRLFHININGNRVLTDFDVLSDAGGSHVADERVFKDVSPAPDGFLHLSFTKAIDYPLINALEITPGLPGRMQTIRIVAQEHSYTDAAGQRWSPDRYFFGGRIVMHPQPVEGTRDPGLYAEEHYGHFDYAIPVAPGRYAVTLYFAETYFGPHNPGKGGLGSRLFDVYCNGVALLRNFDIFKEAGGENRAVTKTFHNLQPNALGKLMLTFVPVTNYASVRAIEVADESR